MECCRTAAPSRRDCAASLFPGQPVREIAYPIVPFSLFLLILLLLILLFLSLDISGLLVVDIFGLLIDFTLPSMFPSISVAAVVVVAVVAEVEDALLIPTIPSPNNNT